MKSAAEFWDKTAPRYAKSPIRDQQSYQKKLAKTQEYLRSDWCVLEFGCGTGSTALIHAPYVEQIVATDISSKMLEIAEQKARQGGVSNITFKQGALESLDLQQESFDAVLGLNILHLIENVEEAISHVHRLLKPGGIFVSSTALIGELPRHWRLLIPTMQFLGLAPYVNSFSKQQLVTTLTDTGFSLDYEWQPRKDSVFIVAQKSA